MKKSALVKAVGIVSLTAVCMTGVVACGAADGGSGLSKGGTVAATVNGTEIMEDEITSQIEAMRTQYGLDEEDAWGQYLAAIGTDPAGLREQVINSYVDQEIAKQGAEAEGITVEDSEIDPYVESMKSQYENEEDWASALEAAGFTEEEYRNIIRDSLIHQKLLETFATDEEPTDEELLEKAQTYLPQYDGAKRSSHILFATDDEATAQSVLDQINAGTLDFAAAAEEYSLDTGSATKGGDVGWDKLTSLVAEYQAALDELEVGQISGLVTSQYGIHIIKCTDLFTAPEELTSLDQLPVEFQDKVREAVKSSKQQEAYAAWLDEQRNAADIVINDMPEGLSYDIDMSAYEAEATTPAPEDATATTEEGSTGEEGAAAESTDTSSDAPAETSEGTPEDQAA